MTREEAIAFFKDMNECTYDSTEAVKMAIKALEEQPSEDCVSREAVLNIIKSICFSEEYVQFRADYGSNGQRDTVINCIKALPSVTPQPKTGHWIEHKHGGIEHIECSKCGIWFLKADLPRKSYCPNCGSCNGDMIKNIMRDITKTISGGTK